MPRASATGAFKLLSSMYLCKPSQEAIAGWASLLAYDTCGEFEELKDALEGIQTASSEAREDLLWDYTRLFVGPYRLPCPPWESVYTSSKKLMMQDAADSARRAYAEFGLTVNDPAVMPDHIGAELDFLAIVLERAGAENGTETDCAGTAGKFLNEHLLNWVPRFTQDLEMSAGTLLYKALARTTRNAIQRISA